MEPMENVLEDVVIVGYGSQKKEVLQVLLPR